MTRSYVLRPSAFPSPRTTAPSLILSLFISAACPDKSSQPILDTTTSDTAATTDAPVTSVSTEAVTGTGTGTTASTSDSDNTTANLSDSGNTTGSSTDLGTTTASSDSGDVTTTGCNAVSVAPTADVKVPLPDACDAETPCPEGSICVQPIPGCDLVRPPPCDPCGPPREQCWVENPQPTECMPIPGRCPDPPEQDEQCIESALCSGDVFGSHFNNGIFICEYNHVDHCQEGGGPGGPYYCQGC